MPPLRWVGVFGVAAAVSQIGMLCLRGEAVSVLGWGLRAGWLLMGLAAIRHGESWDQLWKGSLLVSRWKNLKRLLL